jgi:predicted ester cyclase
MPATDTVRTFMSALESHDFDAAGRCLDDRFDIIGALPQALSKAEFLSFARSIHGAFPDWRYDVHDITEDRDLARAKVTIGGTHEGELVVPYHEPVPATHRRVDMPEQTLEFTFEGDLIRRIRVAELPDGGAPGLLGQLGVEPQPAAR